MIGFFFKVIAKLLSHKCSYNCVSLCNILFRTNFHPIKSCAYLLKCVLAGKINISNADYGTETKMSPNGLFQRNCKIISDKNGIWHFESTFVKI